MAPHTFPRGSRKASQVWTQVTDMRRAKPRQLSGSSMVCGPEGTSTRGKRHFRRLLESRRKDKMRTLPE